MEASVLESVDSGPWLCPAVFHNPAITPSMLSESIALGSLRKTKLKTKLKPDHDYLRVLSTALIVINDYIGRYDFLFLLIFIFF